MISVAIIVFLTAFGCGGRSSYPVPLIQPGDETRSCYGIEKELEFIEQEISRILPQSHKALKNLALGISGYFLLIPWFYLDLTQSEAKEIEAYRQRYDRLIKIADEKNCGLEKGQLPGPNEITNY